MATIAETLQDVRALDRRAWLKLVGLLLVPLLLVGTVLGVAWQRNDRLDKIQGAIVNLDKMVEVNGQMVPMGRQLSAAMVDREDANIDWVLADAPHAQQGLKDGEYAVVVTIPQNFSKAATSMADAATAEQATIDIQTSPAAGVADAAVAQQLAEQARASLNDFVTGNYLGNIYVGFNTMGKQLTTMADGASQLSDGASQLADGVGQLSDGANKAGAGMVQLDDGGTQLATGARQLSDGASQLSAGVDAYTDGAGQVVDGIGQLSAGITKLDAGLQAANGGMSAEQTKQLAQLKAGAAQVAAGAAGLDKGLGTYQATLQSWQQGKLPQQVTDGAAGARTMAVQQCTEQAGAQVGQVTADIKKQVNDGIQTLPETINQQLAGVTSTSIKQAMADYQKLITPEVEQQTATAVAAALAADTTLTDAQKKAITAQVVAAVKQPVSDQVADQIAANLKQGLPKQINSQITAGLQQTVDAGMAELEKSLAPQLDKTVGTMCQPVGQAVETSTIEGFKAGAGAAATGLTTKDPKSGQSLRSGATALSGGASQLSGGVATLVDELPKQAAKQMGQLKNGVHQLATGANTLATKSSALKTGGDELDAGAAKLATGAGELSTGVGSYTDGVHQARLGIEQLATGAGQLDTGAGKLAAGVDTFATKVGEGAKQVPSYSSAQREQLSKVVAAPIAGESRIITPLASAVGLADVLALWVGALATFMVLRPLSRRALSSSHSSASLLAGALAAPLTIGAVQALVLAGVSSAVLDLSTGAGLKLTAVLLVASVAFVAVNHALAALFGWAGRAVAAVLAGLTLAVGLTAAVPGIFTAVHGFTPMAPVLAGLRGIVAGGPGMTGAIGMGIFWALVGLAGGFVAVARARQLTPAQFESRVRG